MENRYLMSPRSGTQFKHFQVSYPHEHVIQVSLNRPERLNCIDLATSQQIQAIWDELDREEILWVGIITGIGRAFCTGADLHEWNELNRAGIVNDMAAPGLAGLPRRDGKKPIIAAVNGICMGGGFEMIANCDVVVAAASATFALSEAKRGIVPVAGSLPRLTRTLGLQRTTELVLTGGTVSAQDLHQWGLVNHVVEAPVEVTQVALDIARKMCQNSPDALIVGRKGIRLAWEAGSVESSVSFLAQEWYPRLMQGRNFAEGIQAFVEKRSPRWSNSKL